MSELPGFRSNKTLLREPTRATSPVRAVGSLSRGMSSAG